MFPKRSCISTQLTVALLLNSMLYAQDDEPFSKQYSAEAISVLDQVDQLSPKELNDMVNRVHNALSREGTVALRALAESERFIDVANQNIKELGEDSRVIEAQKIIASDSARVELEKLSQLGSREEKLAAFGRFMKNYGLKRGDLVALSKLKTWKQVENKAELATIHIDKFLSRQTLKEIKINQQVDSGSALNRLSAILNMFAGEEGTGDTPGPDASPDDDLGLIEALLGS